MRTNSLKVSVAILSIAIAYPLDKRQRGATTAVTVSGQTTAAEFENTRCDLDTNAGIFVDDCLVAVQSQIPATTPTNAYLTTQGGLHAMYGSCHVTLDRSNDAKILKATLSDRSQKAVRSCIKPNKPFRAGESYIRNLAGSASFKLSWNYTEAARSSVGGLHQGLSVN